MLYKVEMLYIQDVSGFGEIRTTHIPYIQYEVLQAEIMMVLTGEKNIKITFY